MFRAEPLADHAGVDLLSTAASLFGRPLMWACFLRVDEVLLDTGNPRCRRQDLLGYLGSRLPDRGAWVINTHFHEDHCGNNALIGRVFGAETLRPGAWERRSFSEVSPIFRLYWGRPELFPSQPLAASGLRTSTGRCITAIHTPGHTPCHHLLRVLPDDILVSGDAIPLARRKVYTMPEEDYIQTLNSLKLIHGLIDSKTLLHNGHLGVLREPKTFIEERIAGMEAVVAEVEQALDRGDPEAVVAARILGEHRSLQERLMGERISRVGTVRSIARGLGRPVEG